MRILLISVTTACALLASARLNAQTAPGAIVAIGCVNHPPQNGSLIATPGVRPATPATADDLANSSERSSAFVLSGATRAEKSGAAGARTSTTRGISDEPTSYVLDGWSDRLERELGHQVEITGTLGPVDANGASASHVAHIRVSGVRTLAAGCPKPSAPSQKK